MYTRIDVFKNRYRQIFFLKIKHTKEQNMFSQKNADKTAFNEI